MLFLDANALYYYFGSDKLGLCIPANIDINKFKSLCDKVNDLALPSSAFMEIVVHFKNDPETLKSIFSFIIEKKIKIWNNIPTYIINDNEIIFEDIFDTLKSTYQYIYKMTKAKKQCELAFSIFFLYEILTIYTYSGIISKKDIPQDDKLLALNFIYKRFLKNNNDYREQLQQAYEEGYAKNDPLRSVKNTFIECIWNACIIIDILIEWECESYRQGKEVDIDTIFEQAFNQAAKYSGNNPEMTKIVKVISKAPIDIQKIIEELSDVFGSNFTESQKKYSSQVLLSQWLLNGQQFKKNDIFDFLWIRCLDYVSTIPQITNCITFDKKMRKFIESYKPYMDDLISSFIYSNR